MLTLDRIYQAAYFLNGKVRKTDIIKSSRIAPDCELYLKTENLQTTGSFKVRGSFFKMSSLTEEEAARGVVACSAGNHAQGVALAAKRCGISATIFLPAGAPISKVEATRRYGAQIRLIDGVYDDAFNAAKEYEKETGAVFVHPFDDIDVIAGQGTIGLEIMEQIPALDAVIAPIGGGGLISGVAYAVKKLNPKCKVYGVQAAGAGGMAQSLEKHERSGIASVHTFADGIAVKNPAELTFSLCSQYVDKVAVVSDDEIATAMLTLMEQKKLVTEGAGAVAVAAAMFNKLPIEGKKVCCIISGGNIDVGILSRVITRGLLTTGRLATLIIDMYDKPGQLKQITSILAEFGANITTVRHNRGGANTDINECYLEVTMETKNHAHVDEIKAALIAAGFNLIDEKQQSIFREQT